jgi:hypothetical protein
MGLGIRLRLALGLVFGVMWNGYAALPAFTRIRCAATHDSSSPNTRQTALSSANTVGGGDLSTLIACKSLLLSPFTARTADAMSGCVGVLRVSD